MMNSIFTELSADFRLMKYWLLRRKNKKSDPLWSRLLVSKLLTFNGLGERAVNGARTRDPQLGKLVLYQLSYYRRTPCASVAKRVEPIPGLEPGTHALRMRCSTN